MHRDNENPLKNVNLSHRTSVACLIPCGTVDAVGISGLLLRRPLPRILN